MFNIKCFYRTIRRVDHFTLANVAGLTAIQRYIYNKYTVYYYYKLTH